MRGKALRLVSALAATVIVASLAAGWMASEDSADPRTAGDEGTANRSAADQEESAAHEDDGGYEHPDVELAAHQPRHDHELSNREGEVPSRAQASEFEHQLEDFVVEGDAGLAEMAERGYVDGSGTLEDPYVISGFRVEGDLKIEDTTRALVIENSYVEGQLSLNFVSEKVYVHHNHVHDLRVNENVERDGPTTAGLFEHNEIEFIGQLRHFGGTFADNEIGPRPDDVVETYLSDTGPKDLPEPIVWNFDGYHLAHVHNNSVQGRVDVQLHGHFHGSCNHCPAHDHADPGQFPTEEDAGDRTPDSRHSYRYHTIDFENNSIRAPEGDIALRFLDEGHAGDDRTANSEPNGHLEDRHEHHQYVRVSSNEVREGQLVFDIVNAEDERHDGLVQEAHVDLADNDVILDRPRDTERLIPAYVVHAADNAQIDARGNSFEFLGQDSAAPEGYAWVTEGEPADTTGFLLHEVAASRVDVRHTQGGNATYGVTLDDVFDGASVVLEANRFDAKEEDRHEA